MSKPSFVNGESIDFKLIRTINKSDLCDIFGDVFSAVHLTYLDRKTQMCRSRYGPK